MGIVVIGVWSGREARALRLSLRMTIETFAEHLGVAVRTVAKWEARGAKIVPLPTMQEALDTVLQRTTREQQARFDVLRREGQPDPAIPLGPRFGQWASHTGKPPVDIDVPDGDEPHRIV